MFQAVDVAVTWFHQSTIMGDKQRNEIQKPVKNTLLSGASHGFPFESFQGSSLLIPVSQDSPSVLNDSAGDANKLGPKDFTNSENIQLTETGNVPNVLGITLEGSLNPSESKPPTTSSQGYAGIFSSFFSAGSQKKQEPDSGQNQQEPSAEVTQPSRPSSSSFATVQSFSPALQVLEPPQNDTSTGTFPLSPTSQSQGQLQLGFEKAATLSENFPAPSIYSQPDQSQAQHFFNQNNTSGQGSGFRSQNLTSNLGFESFYSAVPETVPSGAALTKARSALDLIGGSSADNPAGNSPFSNPFQSNNSTPQFHQTRIGSADSITPIQPPPFGVASLQTGTPLGAPPLSSGITSKNYRRDHHKRLTYAPVPGLTSSTAVSSSYLQPRENISTPTSASSPALTSPFAGIRQPLPGSLSQPALNISEISSGSNTLASSSSTSSSSLQNFFPSRSGVLMTPSGLSSVHSADSFTDPTTVSSLDSNLNSDSQNMSTQSLSTSITFSSHNAQAFNITAPAPPAMNSTYLVSSHSVHPPIMSTREQSPPLASPNPSERPASPVIIPPSLNNLANLGTSGIIYRPVYHHWFIKMETKDSKEIWQPFSMTDSLALEQAFNSDVLTPETVVPTDGGRYDVNVTDRIRTAVYWEEEPKAVRRCSWFYKSTTESRLHPYDENTAYNLEEEYKKAITTNTWSRKVDLPTGDYVLMYGPSSMALFQSTPQTPEGWEAEPDYSQTTQHRPKIVKRGVLDDFDIEEGEAATVDHLIFVVHGIGSVCDFKFRTIEEAGDALDEFLLQNFKRGKVDGFRAKSLQLIKSHFRGSVEEGLVNRVEILPVSWHNQLHGETTGVDKKLQTITLRSIPRLRHFTNDTLLDILFYTSPVYCQNIVQQVGRELNTLYAKFKGRNPEFKGGVSLVGHSLGSLILFDMLCHQKPPAPRMEQIEEESKTNIVQHDITTVVSADKKKRSLSRNVSYVIGNAGTGQPFIEYPQLSFQPLAFFALGSPIGMFVTVRGIESLGLDFCLPTCSRFFNVFHPFDPVAYRIEALINPELAEKRPVLIPHHKGRKRMHLELKETMARVGADLKQRLVDSVRSTWNTVYQLTMFGRADDGLEQEVDQVIEKQLERQRTESVGNGVSESEETDFNAGRLNQGRRIDYVLQEAPLESFNEYVSAITSHVIYWDSEDTMLLILKEIYGSLGISSDSQQSGIPGMPENMGPIPSTSTDPGPSSGNTMYGQPPFYGFK